MKKQDSLALIASMLELTHYKLLELGHPGLRADMTVRELVDYLYDNGQAEPERFRFLGGRPG